jgi:PAS domain S-box-containing protein
METGDTKTLMQMVFSSLTDAVFVVDPITHTITACNPAVENIFGYGQEEVIGRNSEFLHVDRGMYEEFQVKLFPPLNKCGVFHGEYRMRRKDGSFFCTENTVTETVDDFGNRTGMVNVVRDITSRARVDGPHEVRFDQGPHRSRTMEALETFGRGIVHDLNNVFMPIALNTELALRNSAEPDRASEYLRDVLEAAQRGMELLKQIRAFGRRNELKREPVEITRLINESLDLLKTALPATVEIRTCIGVDFSTKVLADPTQFHQVLLNLCTNAVNAMKEGGGVLGVSLMSIEVDEKAAAPHADLEPGPYLKLTVSDTGVGMSPESMERIFEPFFTPKEQGAGAGMGLAVVYGIVRNHGGALTVQSESEKGSAFHVFLPQMKNGFLPKPAGGLPDAFRSAGGD